MASFVVWRRVFGQLLCVAVAGAAWGSARASCAYDTEIKAYFPDAPVVVALTSPANGSSYTAPASVNLQASLTDTTNEVVSKVEFLNGTTVIARATAAPWSATWTAGTAGSYRR